MKIDYSQDDLTTYLERKFDCDGNDLDYELGNFYLHIVLKIYKQSAENVQEFADKMVNSRDKGPTGKIFSV